MERQMGLFGIADFVVKQNRGKVTFLDGVSAMINSLLYVKEKGRTDYFLNLV